MYYVTHIFFLNVSDELGIGCEDRMEYDQGSLTPPSWVTVSVTIPASTRHVRAVRGNF